MTSGRNGNVYGVILVGGRGLRLRPVSTPKMPKAFLPVTPDDRSMFRKTADRIRHLIPSGRIVVVANRSHGRLVRRDLPQAKKGNVLLEPCSRNTAPAIALAAFTIARRDPDATMVIMPADHDIVGERAYLRCIDRAIRASGSHGGSCVTIGIRPAYPATGFGYIKLRKGGRRSVSRVERFVEKPDEARARRYLSHGGYLWNAGIFIMSVGVCIEAFRSLAPAIARGAYRFAVKGSAQAYRRIPSESIDYAIAERLKPIYCVPGDFGWSDMGTCGELRRVLERELSVPHGSAVPGRRRGEPASMRILRRIRELPGGCAQ